MPPAVRAILALALAASAAPARAGAMRCWVDQGVLVAAAEVDGIAGDYILDTGTPRTQVHLDRAQGEGYADPDFRADVRIAGFRLPRRPIQALSLDARTFSFPTPVAGVIGADVLSGFVMDVRYSPCRVALWRPGRAPLLPGARSRPMAVTADGRPLSEAAVADGLQARRAPFVLATGLDAAARLSDDQAEVPGFARPLELLPGGVALRPLRALSFADTLLENAPVGLVPHAELPAGALGQIGPPILARWTLRFDFPRRRLAIAP